VTRADPAGSRRFIRLIAVERLVRGVLLVIAGIYLVTHVGSDFGRLADRAMRAVELNPHRPFLRRFVAKLHHLHTGTVVATGIGATTYGLVEVLEGVGLWLDKLWAEYLTVIATSLLLPFEIYELVRNPSAFKAAGIVVNAVIVAYLAWRLRKRTSR
jgi:uncharacterized membrane protein (DUF2068 family)